jgi:hypothetical protein
MKAAMAVGDAKDELHLALNSAIQVFKLQG